LTIYPNYPILHPIVIIASEQFTKIVKERIPGLSTCLDVVVIQLDRRHNGKFRSREAVLRAKKESLDLRKTIILHGQCPSIDYRDNNPSWTELLARPNVQFVSSIETLKVAVAALRNH